MAAIEHYGNFLKDGIQLECSISHRNFSRSNSSDAGDKMMPLPAIVPELLSGSGSGKHSLRTASYEFDTRSGTTASYEMGNQNSPKPYASSIANNRPFKLPAGRSPQQHYSNQYSPQHQVDSDYNNGVYHQQPVGMNTMIMMPTSSMQPMYTTMAPPGYISHGHPVPPSGPMTGPPDYNNRSQNSYLAPTSPSAASSNPYFAHAGYTQQQPTASAPMNYGNTSYMLPMLPTTNMTSHPTHHPNHTQHHIHPSHQMQPTIRNDHPHYATGNNFPPPAHHSVSFNSGNPQPTMQVDNNQYQYPAAYPHYLNNPTYSMM